MKTAKKLSIFAFIILAAVALLIAAARMGLEDNAVIDADATLPEDNVIQVVRPGNTQMSEQGLPDIDINSYEFVLVDRENSFDTIPVIAMIGTTGSYFDERAVSAIEDLVSACRSAGNRVHVNLAYVPRDSQVYYLARQARLIAGSEEYTADDEAEAAKKVERPDHSEHQTGLAVDFTNEFCIAYEAEALNADTLAWLTAHCSEYGFIQRYPENKENITGRNEPWHFRYVGQAAASYIMEHDLCLEEFIALYK